jgi:hypothetical protein
MNIVASIPKPQRGAALVSVIFLIVVVATLGAFALRTGANQREATNLSIQEIRAEAAALTGVQYGVKMVQMSTPCPAFVPLPNSPYDPGMSGFRVQLSCQALVIVPGTTSAYLVTAIAQFGAFGSAGYVQRVQRRQLSNISGTTI